MSPSSAHATKLTPPLSHCFFILKRVPTANTIFNRMTTSTAFISTFALHLCLCLNLPLPLSSLCPHHSIVLLLSHYLLAILHEIHFSDDQSIIYLKIIMHVPYI